MEREVGGGIGMGNTCKSMADSFQCMTKCTTKKKKKGPLEKEMATHSSILAWEVPGTEELDGATVHGVTKELDTT